MESLQHGGCAARDGDAVLLTGAPGVGKSELLLRLIDRGFDLVADDQVLVSDGWAAAPAALQGLIEVRGLGIIRLPFLARARLALVVRLGRGARLPDAAHCADLDLPMVSIDPGSAAAPQIVALALDGALGRLGFVAGAFR